MSKPQVFRPENALIIAVLLICGTVIGAAFLLIPGLLRGSGVGGVMPYAIALVVVGGVLAILVLRYATKVRRENRPEWLETQAWQRRRIEEEKGRKQG